VELLGLPKRLSLDMTPPKLDPGGINAEEPPTLKKSFFLPTYCFQKHRCTKLEFRGRAHKVFAKFWGSVKVVVNIFVAGYIFFDIIAFLLTNFVSPSLTDLPKNT